MVVTIIVAVPVILSIAEGTAREDQRRRSRWPGRNLGLILAALPALTFAGSASGQDDVDRFNWFTECEPVLVVGEHRNLTPNLEHGSISDRLPVDIERTVRFALRAYGLEADAHYKSWLPTPRFKVVVTTYPPDNRTPRNIDILFQKVVYDRVSDQYGYVTMGNAHGLSNTSGVRRVMRTFLDKYLSVNGSACNAQSQREGSKVGGGQPTGGARGTIASPFAPKARTPAPGRARQVPAIQPGLPAIPVSRTQSRPIGKRGRSCSPIELRRFPAAIRASSNLPGWQSVTRRAGAELFARGTTQSEARAR